MARYQDRLSYKIALIAIIGALYTVLVILLQPISFLQWQVRIADCLIPQVFIFGIPCVTGLTIGGFVGNLVSIYPIDLLVGPLANFLASLTGFIIQKYNKYQGKKRVLWTQLTIAVQSLINAFVVGTILGIYEAGTFYLPILVSWWVGILIGSLIAMNLLGFLIYEALQKTKLFEVEEQTADLQVAVDFIMKNIAVPKF